MTFFSEIETNRDLQETLNAMTEIGIPEQLQGEITKVESELLLLILVFNLEVLSKLLIKYDNLKTITDINIKF